MNNPSLLSPAIEPADLVWRDGVPESQQFGDVYFSRDDGLEETRYVFLQHNRLAERFANVEPGQAFVVAESGFGTGLNFLATWQQWRASNPPRGAVLHFVSVERFPLTASDLVKAHQLWPELADLASTLQAHYPALVQGCHRLVLDGGQVRLTLFFGDALDGWQQLNFQADAWFLDGFAPALNPDLWVDDVVEAVRRHSRPGTTVATFTAVGRVRRALIAAGFAMKKVPGFGRKRDMLAGHFQPDSAKSTAPDSHPAAVTIIGAGIAGCLLARNLAERGINVTVVDAGNGPASAASGNRQGALYVKLGVEHNDQTRLALSALQFAQRCYQPYQGQGWHPCGVLQLADNEREQERQAKFLQRNHYPESLTRPVDAAEASQLAGIPLQYPGLWFPASGWLYPAEVCRQALEHPAIQCRFDVAVKRIERQIDQWSLVTAEGWQHQTQALVLCGGHLSGQLLPEDLQSRFKTIRGQVTLLEENTLNAPNTVICGSRYLNPACQGQSLTGATFDLHDDTQSLSASSQQENLEALETMLPGVLNQPVDRFDALSGRVGFRCTTHDYQPVAGKVVTGQAATDDTAGGLYLLTGLGSKGLAYAPLLAEYLADCLSNQPQALPAPLQFRVRPERCVTPADH